MVRRRAACNTAPVLSVSPRLLLRIKADFPHHHDVVVDRIQELGVLLDDSQQSHERILAAVVRLAVGRLDRLDWALELAGTDWRDLLVAAGLADADWPARLSAWLGPPAPTETASPGTRGELVEPDGRRWLVRRRRIDLRLARRLIHRADVVVVLGESGGFQPRRISATERTQLWQRVRHAYTGGGGTGPSVDGRDYVGYEFTNDSGALMLYLEERC